MDILKDFDSQIKSYGAGEIILQTKDGGCQIMPIEVKDFKNTVLNNGRNAQAKALTNQFGGEFNFWISQMAFGSGGTAGGVPKYVDASRTGLWGPVAAVKPVISTVDPNNPTRCVFTSVLLFEDAVGSVINEMGLIMANNSYYSITTFGDITKTSILQLTINWAVNYI